MDRRDRHHHAGIRAVSDHRLDRGGVDVDRAVELSARIALEFGPARERQVPVPPGGGARATLQVLVGDGVGRDHAGARAGFDGHVAHRHALLHGERAYGRAAVFDYMARATGDTDLADDGEDQVLGGDSRRQSAFDIDGEGLRLALQEALRGEHMAHLGAADAEGEGAEGAVRARVAVAADDGHTGPARAELRTDDVHDAAPRIFEVEELHAELCRVVLELAYLSRGGIDLDGDPAEHLIAQRRRGMIHGRERAIRATHRQAERAQHAEGLR